MRCRSSFPHRTWRPATPGQPHHLPCRCAGSPASLHRHQAPDARPAADQPAKPWSVRAGARSEGRPDQVLSHGVTCVTRQAAPGPPLLVFKPVPPAPTNPPAPPLQGHQPAQTPPPETPQEPNSSQPVAACAARSGPVQGQRHSAVAQGCEHPCSRGEGASSSTTPLVAHRRPGHPTQGRLIRRQSKLHQPQLQRPQPKSQASARPAPPPPPPPPVNPPSPQGRAPKPSSRPRPATLPPTPRSIRRKGQLLGRRHAVRTGLGAPDQGWSPNRRHVAAYATKVSSLVPARGQRAGRRPLRAVRHQCGHGAGRAPNGLCSALSVWDIQRTLEDGTIVPPARCKPPLPSHRQQRPHARPAQPPPHPPPVEPASPDTASRYPTQGQLPGRRHLAAYAARVSSWVAGPRSGLPGLSTPVAGPNMAAAGVASAERGLCSSRPATGNHKASFLSPTPRSVRRKGQLWDRRHKVSSPFTDTSQHTPQGSVLGSPTSNATRGQHMVMERGAKIR